MLSSLLCEEQRNYAKAIYELQILYHEAYSRFHRKIRSNETYSHSVSNQTVVNKSLLEI